MRFHIHTLSRAALMTAITCVCSVVAIPLPISPAPVTLALFAVVFCGMLLSPGGAVLSQVGYLFLGCVGLPVFSGFSSGVGVLFGPTGGYLLMYPVLALLVSLGAGQGNFRRTILGIAGGMVCCYGVGTLWMALVMKLPFSAAFFAAVVPFLLPDGGKILLAVWLGRRLRRFRMG